MKKIFISIFALAILASGCKKDFFDINTNPNSPTSESVTPDLILPLAQHETGRILCQNYAAQARWMGWWARGGDYGPSAEEETYNITTTFGQGTWGAWYNVLNDYNEILKKTSGTTQYIYEAIARIMKAVGFMHLVDTYDNVPYSQAFNLSSYITPKYDKGADIYKDLLKELDVALTLLNKAVPGGDPKINTNDIMFGGNTTKWKKFLNTMRLKLVLRLSQTSGIVTPATELQKVTSDGFLGAAEDASVNPGYSAIDAKQNPFWDAYKLSAQGVEIDRYNRANNYTLNALRNASDIRYQYYYSPAQTPVAGNIYYGYNFGENLPNGDPYKSINSSNVAGPGIAKSASQSQWIMTSIESMFLQAEAIQRGYLSGSAQTAYENAVRESFRWLGISSTTANAYITSGHPLVDWATATDKIKLIVTQKYFSTVGMSPFEAWADFRRTGFPDNIPYTRAANAGPNIPVRYRYPQLEYNYNSVNVSAEGNPSPFTGKVFWDK